MGNINNLLESQDVLSASMAECYITVDGRRYNFMQALEVTIEMKKTKKKVAILGKTGMGNKATGWEGTGKAKFYMNMSLFRKKLLEFMHTGKDFYFEMMISIEDPTSTVGRQTVIIKNCNLDGGILAKFKAGDDFLEEEANFTFDDAVMQEEFKELEGFAL